MPIDQLQLNDVGTVLEITTTEEDGTTIVDISSATSLVIKIKKPVSGTVLQKTATFTTDGTDGKFECTIVVDDLDEIGLYYVQGYIVMPSWEGHTDRQEMYVNENL